MFEEPGGHIRRDPLPLAVPPNSGDFGVDPLTGALRLRIPVRTTPGREAPDLAHALQPDLALTYLSGRGNSPFGLGWRLDVPSIGRRTRPEVPRYGEDDDSYEHDGDELLPALRVGSGWVDDRFAVGEYVIQRFRRRYEGAYHRIERWLHQPSGQVHWRTVDTNNVTSIFGSSIETRISDPADTTRILRWLLAERYDDRGNIARYSYKAEDGADVDFLAASERHRADKHDMLGGARYLSRIEYANAAPHDRKSFQLFVALDYGEFDDDEPSLQDDGVWDVRPDPYSSYRSGFETRTWRRCRRVLMFHRTDDLDTEPTLVGATELRYDASRGYSLLTEVQYVGVIQRSTGLQRKGAPPVRLGYQRAEYDDAVHSLEADAVLNTLIDERSLARWVDLHSEGLPGLLSRLGDSWYYARNLGAGRFAEAEVVAAVAGYELPEPPVDIPFEERRFTELAHEREYQPMTTLRTTANVNQDDPYVGYLDLNGDDADDVVVADERVIRWYPSQGDDGFGDPVVLRLDSGDHTPARRMYADAKQSFHVADMNGDGLFDLVRVRQDEIVYWPNQGRGRFGNRIVVEGAPQLPEGGAGHNRVLLVDINGSGANDLVWIGDGELMFWENRSGNHFGEPHRVAAPGLSPDAPGLSAVDLHGDGLACIVWIDRSAGPGKLSYVSPLSRLHPDVLNRIDNGRGAETRFSYIPSTRSWLSDRASGGSWLTAMPHPVQVVHRIETRDRIAGSRQLSRFAYHHGYFDEQDGAFAGFAYVERFDGGDADDYASPGLFPDEPVPAIQTQRRPVMRLTKTWRHTGTQFEDADLSVPLKEEFFHDQHLGRAKWLTGHQMPLGQQARDIPHGHRALRGQLLREEHYALDGPPLAHVPFRVVEQTAWVRQVQPAQASAPPSYDVRLNERVVVDYERDVNDPRVQHDITLSLDEYGVATRTVAVQYGRRRPEHAVQGTHRVVVTDTTMMHRGDQGTWYRINVPSERSVWELSNLRSPGGSQLFEARELRVAFDEASDAEVAADVAHKRLLERERTRYWSNDLARQLPVGELESRALVARVERLALTDEIITTTYDRSGVREALQFEGGYEVEDECWWAPGPTTTYDASRFYLPSGQRDAVGRETTYRWDRTALRIEAVEDGFGHVERHLLHPRTLQPWQHIDVNGNVVARRFDALGEIMSEAVMGKPEKDEGDVLALGSIEASAHDNPTVVVTSNATVDLSFGSVSPGWVRRRQRVQHRDTATGLQDTISYTDGFGRAAGAALRTGDDQWLLTDFVERDAHGAVVRRAIPFFSQHPWPVDAELRVALERGDQLTYDALGREVRRDHSDGTFITRDIKTWSVVEGDQNDNVLESRWYAERQSVGSGRAGDFAARQAAGAMYAMRAAAIAAGHARTPTVHLLDALDAVVVVRAELTGQRVVERQVQRDAVGHITRVVDTKGRPARAVTYDLLGRVIAIDHLDAGRVTELLAATNDVLRRQDAQGRSTRYRYDAIGQRTHTLFSSGVGPEALVERVIYGGGDVAVPDASSRNLINRPHVVLGGGGCEVFDDYDAAGNVLRQSYRPLRRVDHTPDWSVIDEIGHVEQVDNLLVSGHEALLADEHFVTSTELDALGRPLRWSGPGDLVIDYAYVDNGLVGDIGVSMSGRPRSVVLDGMRYDAFGRHLHMRLGNGVIVSRRYDQAGWLVGIDARGRHNEQFQNQRLVRDALGNVLSVSRDAQLFESYSYDELGRLIRAEGIEPPVEPEVQAAEGAAVLDLQPEVEPGDQPALEAPLVQRFATAYALDGEHNLVELKRKMGAQTATVAHDYHASSNRLRAMSSPDDAPGAFSLTYQHDESGNIVHSAAPEEFRWDSAGRLVGADGAGGVRVRYAYGTDGTLRHRLVERPGGVREEFVFIGPFERRRRYEGDEVVLEQFAAVVRNEGVPVAVVQRTSIDRSNLEDDRDRTIRYELVDHVGSVVMELSQDAEVITEESFLPFGRVAKRRGRSTIELSTKRHGFRGGRSDAEAGLVLYGTRWYSPLLGRWVHPAAGEDGTNPYAFYRANPQTAE